MTVTFMSVPRSPHKECLLPAIRDIKGEYGIMGVLKKTFRREKAISAK